MAEKKDDPKAAEGADAAGGKSGLMKFLIPALLVFVVPLTLVGLVTKFVIAPRVWPSEVVEGGEHAAEAHAEEEHAAEAGGHDEMAHAAAIEFEDESVNVMPDAPGGKPALLSYKCAIVVNSHELELVVGDKAKKPFFSSILLRLHSNRTKTELNDPRVKESILRQAKQEANAMVKKLLPEDKEAKVLEVLHIKYTIFEI